jgi:hypothetical protein
VAKEGSRGVGIAYETGILEAGHDFWWERGGDVRMGPRVGSFIVERRVMSGLCHSEGLVYWLDDFKVTPEG